MKTVIYNRVKTYIKYYFEDINDLIRDMNAAALPSDMTTYSKIRRLVENGCFACSYHQMQEDLAEFYGNEYDNSRYHNKNGDLKYRDGECYLATIYRHMVALAGEKMVKEYQGEA